MLPSLSALKAFEATVRTGSVRAAALELNVVHGAVSQQIRALEQMLGLPLFERRGRRLVLTQPGQRYSDAINVAFGVIERAGEELRPAGPARPFRLGMMAAHAAYWFIPKLSQFSALKMGFDIEIVTTPTQRNLEGTTLDAIIIGGEYEPRPDLFGAKFMDDIFAPVASAHFAEEHRLAGNIEALSTVTGINSNTTPLLWEAWFYESEQPAIRFRKRQGLESLALTIEAARAGLGVAIVPYPHVAKDIEDGRLVAPYGLSVRAGGYHFCCRKLDMDLPRYRKMLNWLLQVATPPTG